MKKMKITNNFCRPSKNCKSYKKFYIKIILLPGIEKNDGNYLFLILCYFLVTNLGLPRLGEGQPPSGWRPGRLPPPFRLLATPLLWKLYNYTDQLLAWHCCMNWYFTFTQIRVYFIIITWWSPVSNFRHSLTIFNIRLSEANWHNFLTVFNIGYYEANWCYEETNNSNEIVSNEGKHWTPDNSGVQQHR